MPASPDSIVFPDYLDVGDGYEAPVSVSNKAGGFFQMLKVPGDYWYAVLAVSFNLTTDATAGNRSVALEIRGPNGLVIATVPASVAQAPASVSGYQFGVDYAAGVSPSAALIAAPWPRILMQSTWSVFMDTVGAAAGDSYTGISLFVRQFPTSAKPPAPLALVASPLVA